MSQDELDEGERLRRPEAVVRVTFEGLAAPGPWARVDKRGLVPIESARAGDEQVFAARLPGRLAEPVVDLEGLSGTTSVRSVVASTLVRARGELPQIEELLLLDRTFVPDGRTLRALTGLRRFWAGWSPSDRRLEASALPAGLEALGVSRAVLRGSGGGASEGAEGLAALARLGELRHLVLEHCLPKDSMQPVAALTRLVRLRANAPAGWASLAACAALEEVVAIGPRLANLRALGGWSRLRDLTLTGSGLRNLAGLEAFGALERLKLVMLGTGDLAPLGGLPRLAAVELVGLTHTRDLGPLGRLPALRRLVIARAGIESRDILQVDSLRPLAGARALEEVVLRATEVADGTLAPLAGLPVLRRVEVYGELGPAVAELRQARPDLEVVWRSGWSSGAAGGAVQEGQVRQVGPVRIHPAPAAGAPRWWLREDLTELLGVDTNAEAEERLRQALLASGSGLAARLDFDTEGDAVVVEAESEDDIRAVARMIGLMARGRAHI